MPSGSVTILQPNGQFDVSQLLASCPPLSSSQISNVTVIPTATLRLPFTGGTSTNKGLLGNYTTSTATTVDPNAYMTFDVLNNTNDASDHTSRAYWLQQRYSALLAAGVIPTNPALTTVQNNLNSGPNTQNPVSTYNTAVANFLQVVGAEFCYYQTNYFNALNQFLYAYATASSSGAGAINIPDFQQTALILNQKVNTMIILINYLANKNVANLRILQGQLNAQNGAISTSTASLLEQGQILSDNNNSNKIYRQMVEYTEEKNRANKNLLAVYFTLNVVAIACLFIAARTL
jgi:hypothetical protein